MNNNKKFWAGIFLFLPSMFVYADTSNIVIESPIEIYTVLFLVYIISLLSAGFCVWVKWEQEVVRHLMLAVDKNNIEIQKRLDRLDAELAKIEAKNPFPTR